MNMDMFVLIMFYPSIIKTLLCKIKNYIKKAFQGVTNFK